MYLRTLFLFLFVFCFISVGFSYINVSSCSPSWIDGEEYRLNESFVSGGICLSPNVDNIIIDCQGNTIIGSNTAWQGGIYITSGRSNISVKNCIVSNFSPNVYLRSSSNNLTLYNLTLINSSGQGIHLNDNVHNVTIYDVEIYGGVNGLSIANNNYDNTFYNFTIYKNSQNGITESNNNLNFIFHDFTIYNNTLNGIYSFNFINSTFYNFKVFNNGAGGVRLRDEVFNNTFYNNDFRNNLVNDIYIYKSGGSGPSGNIFYNNYFSSGSNFFSHPSLYQNSFNLGSIGNYWDDFNSSINPPYCNIGGNSSFCDNYAKASFSINNEIFTSTNLPSFGVSSSLIFLSLIVGFLII